MVGLTSAAGLVSFLSEPDPDLQVFALQRLDDEIENVWTEVSAAIGQIEALYENESFPERQLAALVLSKVYYQLQEYDEAMVFALAAGPRFHMDRAAEYEETIVAKCIDTWIALYALHNPPGPASSTAASDLGDRFAHTNGTAGPTGGSAAAAMSSPTMPFSQSQPPSKSLLSREDPKAWDSAAPGGGNAGVSGAHPHPLTLSKASQNALREMIRHIFHSCYQVGAFKQVVGIAVEARNMDFLREAIEECARREQAAKGKGKAASQTSEELMEYILDICMNVVQERGLRHNILRLILGMLRELPNPDYFAIARCVVYLDQYAMASDILKELVQKGDGRSLAVAYQLSFDLYENGTQEFLQKVMEALPDTDVEGEKTEALRVNGDAVPPTTPFQGQDEDARETDPLLNQAGPTSTLVANRTKPHRSASSDQHRAYAAMRDILRGTTSIELNLEFLFRAAHVDKVVLNKIRDALEARNSIFHTAVTFANAFMHAGTTVDAFFRENLEWLGKAVNWSKFTATAALGVIHRGNLSQGQKLLDPYLPKDTVASGSGSPYSQGGSLFALGLIYTNHGTHVLEYLRRQFTATQEEVVQHGGALGLGVAGMATGSQEIFDELKNVLYQDSAINGEAVGLAMGLVMLGTGNIKALDEMIQYAHDTQHEKIVRGLALGMALIMYARQEAADELINGLLEDADPALRYGGILTIALAYAGSSSNKAVRKLLHVAVSDVSDDVRRVAVLSLGFVLFRKPGSVPRMVELLAESYNPHVRYGATMALGIACAGTGLPEAVELLEPMLKDSVDFVRQGALIASAMILVQANEARSPRVTALRRQLQKTVGDRHEDAMAKFGAAIALGVIDAGGRNCTLGLQTPTGNLNLTAIVGMAVFTQYWYWFPLTHFLALTFTPTAIIGVEAASRKEEDKEEQGLVVPRLSVHCHARPSLWEYPPEVEIKVEEVPEKVKTAVLSTTAQAKRRKLARDRLHGRESMEVEVTPTTPRGELGGEKMEVDAPEEDHEQEAEEEAGAKKRKGEQQQKEKVGFEVENMSRVLPGQMRYISFPAEGRYQPVKKPTGGVILLIDTRPDEPRDLLELKARKKTTPSAPQPGGGAGRPQTPGGAAGDARGAGAVAAAGVLTAVDEDDGEEAPVPDAFDVDEEDGDEDEEMGD